MSNPIDPRTGLWGQSRMRQKHGRNVRQHQYQNIRRPHPVNRQKRLYKPIRVSRVGHIQMDFADVRRYKRQNNGNPNYILVVIDVFSRYTWAIPTQTRDQATYLPLLQTKLREIMQENWFQQNGRILSVFADQEFAGAQFTQIFTEFGNPPIKNTATNYKTSTSIVEGAIKTLKMLIRNYITAHNTITYNEVLNDLVFNYNNTKHSAIGQTPKEALDSNDWFPTGKQIKQYKDANQELNENELSVGDIVRIYLKDHRKPFVKADDPEWSTETYPIEDKYSNHMYKVNNAWLPRWKLWLVRDANFHTNNEEDNDNEDYDPNDPSNYMEEDEAKQNNNDELPAEVPPDFHIPIPDEEEGGEGGGVEQEIQDIARERRLTRAQRNLLPADEQHGRRFIQVMNHETGQVMSVLASQRNMERYRAVGLGTGLTEPLYYEENDFGDLQPPAVNENEDEDAKQEELPEHDSDNDVVDDLPYPTRRSSPPPLEPIPLEEMKRENRIIQGLLHHNEDDDIPEFEDVDDYFTEFL